MNMMMKKVLFSALLLLGLCATAAAQSRETTAFDADWRFSLGDPKNAQSASFNDRSWRSLDLPHDWTPSSPHPAAARSAISRRGPAGTASISTSRDTAGTRITLSSSTGST